MWYKNDAVAIAQSHAATWHGKETRVNDRPTIEQIIAAGGLDFEIVPMDVTLMGSVDAINGHKALVNTKTGEVLTVASNRYKPHQPRVLVEAIAEVFETSNEWAFTSAGAFNGGRLISATVQYSGDANILGDRHTVYACLSTRNDRRGATRANVNTIRVVCHNTTDASRAAGAKAVMSHSSCLAIEQARILLACAASAGQDIEAYRLACESLQKVKFSRDRAHEFMQALILGKDAETTRAKNIVAAMIDSLAITVDERGGELTGYTVLNGVSRYTDHSMSVKGGVREVSSLYGTGAAIKAQAFDTLMAMA